MAIFERVTIKDVKVEIGDMIKLHRKQRKLNQDELAAQLNMSRITISNLEQGKNTTLDTLLKALLYFDVLDNFHQYLSDQIKANQQNSLY